LNCEHPRGALLEAVEEKANSPLRTPSESTKLQEVTFDEYLVNLSVDVFTQARALFDPYNPARGPRRKVGPPAPNTTNG